jgi:hypothetical protein
MEFLPALLLGGAVLGGAYLSSQANAYAAQIQYDAQMQQAEAIRVGNEMADKRLRDLYSDQTEKAEEYEEQLGPPTDYLQTVMATNPNLLTQGQNQQLEDTRQQGTAMVNKSSLRGAGGYLPAVLKSVETDAKGKMVATNQARKDAAANRSLSTYGSMATGAQARGDATGYSAAMLPSSAGQAYGGAVAGAGDAAARGVVGSTQPYVDAIIPTINQFKPDALSQIASIAATEEKESRSSRFNKDDTVTV